MTAIVELKNATKVVKNGFDEEKIILNDVSLEIFEQDFITILGEMVLENQLFLILLQELYH